MAAEVIDFSDMFDSAFTSCAEFKEITNRNVPLLLFTDNKSFFDVISKG